MPAKDFKGKTKLETWGPPGKAPKKAAKKTASVKKELPRW